MKSSTLVLRESMESTNLTYVLVTPARNEAAFIERTIQSVITQTILPLKWIIVSDGSTDGTDEIVGKYAASYPWIELVRMPERKQRHFAAKVQAFNTGYTRMAGIKYDVIGNLDADVSFEADYFAFLMGQFAENSRLGVAGTPFTEGKFQYDYRFTSIEHVSGQIQMFRKACFEEIGGYVPIKTGGIDLVAVITARMKGWQTRTFTGKSFEHHRKMSSANHRALGIAFDGGKTDYSHGCDPLWQICRSIYQMTNRPLVLHGACLMAGYFWAMVTRTERVVPTDLIRFRKIEQRRRLREFVKGMVPWRRS